MKVVSKVDGVLRGLALVTAIVACAPKVTVSRDDESAGAGAGGEGAEGPTGGRSTGGRAGSPTGGNPTGGSAGSETGGNPTGGSGGDGGSYVPPLGGFGGDAGNGNIAGYQPGDGGRGPNPCPCSRRPTAPVSFNCPRGSGESVSMTIGPDGGDALLAGTTATRGAPFRIEVFAGSLEEQVELTLTELTLAPHEDFFDYSPVFRVEPDELDFVNGGEVSIPWQVANGQVPGDLAIYHSDSPDGPFELLADSYQNAGFSQATLLRSGYFLVASPKPSDYAFCP